jgi:hypothetical protein
MILNVGLQLWLLNLFEVNIALDFTGVVIFLVVQEVGQLTVCAVMLKILKPKKTCWIS